jgi:hypothetical protein
VYYVDDYNYDLYGYGNYWYYYYDGGWYRSADYDGAVLLHRLPVRAVFHPLHSGTVPASLAKLSRSCLLVLSGGALLPE